MLAGRRRRPRRERRGGVADARARGGEPQRPGRAAHVLADLLGSAGVILAGLIVLSTGWVRRPGAVDPDRAARAGELVGRAARVGRDPARVDAARDRRRGGGPRDGRPARRARGARPPHLDDHERLPGPLGPRARGRGRRLPRAPGRARASSSASVSASTTRRCRWSTRPAASLEIAAGSRPSRARRRSSPARRAASAPRSCRRSAPEGARVAGGAAARRSDSRRRRARARRHRPGELRGASSAAAVGGLGGLDILVNGGRPRPRPRPVLGVVGGGRADRARDERERPDPDDAPLPPARPRRRPHRQHRLDRGPPGVPERLALRDLEVRRARASRTRCARTCSAGRSASRRSIPGSSRRTSRACASGATRRRRKAVYEGVEAMTPEDVADCIRVRVTRPPHVNVDELVVKALAQSSGGRILRTELMTAHDPRGLDLLHLRRPRGHRHGGTSGLLLRGHALPLAALGSRSTASARCCSPPTRSSTSRPRSSCATRSTEGCRRTCSRSRASASSATGMQDRIVVRTSRCSASRSSSRLEVGHRLRRPLHRQGPRLLARRPAPRAQPLPPPIEPGTRSRQFVMEAFVDDDWPSRPR